MSEADIAEKFHDPNTMVIYSSHLLTRCPICGNLFAFMGNSKVYKQMENVFLSGSQGSVKCCEKQFILQLLREMDAIHVHMGRHLERDQPEGFA